MRRLRLAPVDEDRVGHRLVAEEDVLGDGQDRDQHEVLVDHADAPGDGIGRPGDADLLRHRAGSAPRPAVARPYRMFISVVLPAPFSPSRAWISPGRTSRLISSLASDTGIALRDPAHLERGRGHVELRQALDLGHLDRLRPLMHR